MIDRFVAWLDSLTWAPALIFSCCVVVVICVLILFVDWWIRGAEYRAIRRRDRQAARRWAERRLREIRRGEIDRAYRNGQFRTPYSMTDKKGVTRL
jgi:hypothetical protein